MKKEWLYGIGGLAAGIILMMFILVMAAPGMMILEDESPYDFATSTAKFEQAVTDAGWKIPAVHNLQGTMTKFGHDVKAVTVYELCHPDHAYKILKLDDERIVASMMPCRMAFYEKSDGKTYYSRMNSNLVSKLFGGTIADVMSVAFSENEEIIENMKK